jgi:hypothetical protein
MKKKAKKKWLIKPSDKKLGLNYILNFYDCYVREKSLAKVAAAMNTVPSAISDKIRRFPILLKVMAVADINRTKNNLRGYVVKHMSPEAKRIWEQLQKDADSIEAIERLWGGKPKKLRQEIFAYVMMTSGFNVSAAMRATGVTKKQLDGWKDDFEFLELIEEINFQKKNFFENQVIGLVAEGHPGAVLAVNKTINADRGYSEKLELKHSGNIDNGDNIKIEELDLDLETRKKVLEAVRRLKEGKAAANAKPIIAPSAKLLREDNEEEEDEDDESV